MRYLRYMVLGFIAISLIVVALANRGAVNLSLLPEALGALVGFNVQMQVPLFVVIFGGLIAGLLVGFVWEWFREHSMRAEASKSSRNVRRLEREIARMKGQNADSQDDVLALLDKAS